MRLIDADKVKEYILKEGFYCDTEADKEATAKEIDSLFPTVKAIPVGWISKYSRKPISNADYWAIMRMVTAWEEENEKQKVE